MSNGAFLVKVSIIRNGMVHNSTNYDINIIWSSFIPVEQDKRGFLYRLIESTYDPGHYITVGVLDGFGILVTKFNSSGYVVASKLIETMFTEYGSDLLEKSNGDIFIVGGCNTTNWENDVLVIRMNGDLNSILWAQLYGGEHDDYSESMIELSTDGSLVIVGKTYGTAGEDDYDAFLLRIDASDGSVIFAKAIGGSDEENGISVVETFDNMIVVSGTTRSFGVGSKNLFLFKIDPADVSTVIWCRAFGWPKTKTFSGASRYTSVRNYMMIEESVSHDLVILNVKTKGSTQLFMLRVNSSTGFIKKSVQQDTERSYVYGFGIVENRPGSPFYSSEIDSSYTVVGAIKDYNFDSSINPGVTEDNYYYHSSIQVFSYDFEICENSFYYPSTSVVSLNISDVQNNFDTHDFASELRMITLTPTNFSSDSLTDEEMDVKRNCVMCSGYIRDERNENMCVHGSCYDYWKCDCDDRYFEPNCEVYDVGPYCGYYRYDEPGVCGGDGTCVSEYLCECEDGYHNEDPLGRGEEAITCRRDEFPVSGGSIAGIVLGGIFGMICFTFCLVFIIVCPIIVIVLCSLLLGLGISVIISSIRGAVAKKKENNTHSTSNPPKAGSAISEISRDYQMEDISVGKDHENTDEIDEYSADIGNYEETSPQNNDYSSNQVTVDGY